MQVKKILDLVEILLFNESTQTSLARDRQQMLRLLTLALGSLNDQFNLFLRKLDPLIRTSSGVREYFLPLDFGGNFVKEGRDYVCKVRTSTEEWTLEFEPVERFYQRDLQGETASRPSVYSLLSDFTGRKKLLLSPLPDDEYEIYGIYRPSEFEISEETDLALVDGFHYLVYYLASLADPKNPRWLNELHKAEKSLYLNEAREKDKFFQPPIPMYQMEGY